MLVNPTPKEKKKIDTTCWFGKGKVGHCSSIDMNFILFLGGEERLLNFNSNESLSSRAL
jgi:hypothetical protein